MVWEGLEEAESTREPVSPVFHDASAVLRKELKVLRPKAEQKREVVQWYGLILCIVIWGWVEDSELPSFWFSGFLA